MYENHPGHGSSGLLRLAFQPLKKNVGFNLDGLSGFVELFPPTPPVSRWLT